MATVLISALGNLVRKVVLIGTAGFNFWEKHRMQESAEEGFIDKVCLDGLLSEVMEVDEKLTKFLVENSDKAGNITSLVIPTVTFAALAYGIMCLKVFELCEKINVRNRQVNNINQRLVGLESILLAKKTQSSGELEDLRNYQQQKKAFFNLLDLLYPVVDSTIGAAFELFNGVFVGANKEGRAHREQRPFSS